MPETPGETSGHAHVPSGLRDRRALLLGVPALVFAALAIVFGYALLVRGDPTKLKSALIGRQAPNFALAPIEGLVEAGRPVPAFSTADLAMGNPTVVNFWASWCAPCVDEHPLLIELKRRTGVTIVGVNYKDQPANARRFLARHGNPFSAVGADPSGRVAIEWGVYGMPETFVVDGAGRVVFKHVGPLSQDILEKRLIQAIADARRGP